MSRRRADACVPMLEDHPRKGVELFNTCDAPTTPASFIELLICDLVTIGALLLAVWAVAERVQELMR